MFSPARIRTCLVAAVSVLFLWGCPSGDDDGRLGPGPCPNAATADAREPNDDRLVCSAVALPHAEIGLTLHDATDEDWFCFDVLQDATLVATATFEHDDGDIDMQFLDATGIPLDLSATDQDVEQITRTVMAGQYLVRLYGPTQETNCYELQIEAQSIGPLLPDSLEPNDSGALCTPVILPFDTRGSGQGPLTIHDSADEDWFCVNLSGTGHRTVTVDLIYVAALGNLDLEILYRDPDGIVRTIDRAETPTDNEEIVAVLRAGAANDYFVRVYGVQGGTNLYDLVIDTVTGGGMLPDIWEPNETFSTPNPIWQDADLGPLPANRSLTIDSSIDHDYMGVSRAQPGPVTVDLTFTVDYLTNPIHGFDLDLEILDDRGAVVAAAETPDDDETLTFQATVGVLYRVHVYGFRGAPNSYQFTITAP